MPFDPSQPAQIVEEPADAGFDPGTPFQIVEEPPSPSLQTAIPAPGEQARTVRGSVLAGPTQAFPATEQTRAEAAVNPIPELTATEAEWLLTTPQVSIPRVGDPGTITRGLSELGSGLVEQAALTPLSPMLALATAVPGVRVAAGALLSAAAAKGAAQKLGEASVTGDPQTITEGLGAGVLAGLGAAGVGLEAVRAAAPATAEAVRSSGETLNPPKLSSESVGVLPSPGNRPLGIVSPITPTISAIRNLFTGATEEGRLFLKGAAGESLPRMVETNSTAAEAGVSYASARVAAPLKAQLFVEKTLEGTGVDPVALGAALTEDNLRSVREQRIAAGEAPEDVTVNTVIGKRGSPFADEASYQAFLEQPETKQAIEQYKQLWTEIKEPQYRLAASIDPETPLATRGLQTGARVNLFPLAEGEPTPVSGRIVGGGGGGNLLATLRRKSPFARTATGEGGRYVVDLHDIMANSFDREYAIAMKNKMDNALIEGGDAVVSAPGKKAPELVKGEKAVAFPYRNLNMVAESGETLPLSRNLYVRQSLASEYRALAGVDKPIEIPILTKQIGDRLTKAALQGLSEGTIHVSNLLTGLFTRPGPTSNLLVNSLLKVTGRADVPVTLTRAMVNAFRENKGQLVELAELGALKEPYRGSLMGPLLTKVDQAVRVTLDNVYQGLAEKGVVENSVAARREFVNQVGQYNKRLQGPLIRALRETQFGPFATAGRAFNVLGYRTATLSPGVRATGKLAAAALRADALAGWIGAFSLAAAYNYLTTGEAGGSPGTRLGDLDLGIDDAGKHKTFPLADLLGYGRALRTTGVRGVVESKRIGLSNANAVQRGVEDATSSAINPALGPAVRTAFMAATGKRMAIPAIQEAPLEPAQSETPQVVRNVEHALIEANPIVASVYELKQGRPVMDVLQRQLTRFAPRSAPTSDLVAALPRIIDKRQMEDYLDDVARRARKLTPVAASALFDSAADALDKLEDPRLRREGRRILKGKRRFVE